MQVDRRIAAVQNERKRPPSTQGGSHLQSPSKQRRLNPGRTGTHAQLSAAAQNRLELPDTLPQARTLLQTSAVLMSYLC